MVRYLRAVAFRIGLKLLADGKSEKGRPGKNRSFERSLKNALRGLLLTFAVERNFRFECFIALLALALGFAFDIDRLEWAVILTNVFFVLSLEAKNTSTEMTVDLATAEFDYDAKSSKDASSGAVLLAAFSSLVSGGLIFGPRLFDALLSLIRFISTREF